MTNNTTSHGGDFTIKPLTTSIDFKTERQLIAAWSMAVSAIRKSSRC